MTSVFKIAKGYLSVCFLFAVLTGFSQTITTGTISSTSYCQGDAINVPYTISGSFNSGNTFTVELSDASGSFSSPTSIGSLSATVAGTIAATIPSGSSVGTAYRVRVVSNNPVIIGANNGTDLIINTMPTAPSIGAITQPSCALATGSVILNGLPSGSWIVTQTPGGIESSGTGTTTTISGLSPGTYSYTVENSEQGLKAEYFNNIDLSGSPALTRTDTTIDFNWGSGGPGAPIGDNYFSARWTGQVLPLVSDTYIFRTRSDDGIRLWVNGVQVINNWTNHGATYNYSSSISLVAGNRYDIVLEYYENNGQAVAELDWNRSGATTYVTIPGSQLIPDGADVGCNSPSSGDVVISAYSGTPSTPTPTNGIMCIGATESVTLSASGAPSGGYYTWYSAAIGGTPLKTSTDETDNTFNTPAISTSTNYWVATVSASGCVSERAMVSAILPSNSPDSQLTAGTDSWIGHVYDGNNYSVAYNGNFTNYYGEVTETEEFDQGFGGNTTCYNLNSSLGIRSIYTEYFSVRYRMNSTKHGLYVVNIGSDDGSRLQIDGSLVYNYWTPRGYVKNTNVLINLNGSSALVFDFFENSGSNRVSFNGLTQVLGNVLDTNTTQAICQTGVGIEISGDEYGTLPSGITVSGTGYQWAYGTTTGGPWVDISGETGATYIPMASDFGSVSDGDTVYVIRKAILSSTNNVGMTSPYVIENKSNVATIVIDSSRNIWTGIVSTDWNDSGNWGCGSGVPDLTTNIFIPSSVANQPVIFSGDAGALANDIELETGSTLTINDNSIEIDGDLFLNGFINLEGEAQLLQTNGSTINPASSGYLEQDQQGKANSFNYNYWSSPVNTGALSYNLSAVLKDGRTGNYGDDIVYSTSAYGADTAPVGTDPLIKSSRWLYLFNGASNDYSAWIKIDENTTISAGQGFTMKGSLGAVPLTNTLSYVFKGLPNNGPIDLSITVGNDMLIGNPYPSALDANQFIKDNIAGTNNDVNIGNNTDNVINGALYFWDHFGKEDSHYLAEYVGGYATYNLMGATVAISNDALINNNDATGSKVPGQYIPVGQGFFVSAELDPDIVNQGGQAIDVVGGAIQFNNSQRVFEVKGTNSVFMKSSQKSTKTAVDTRPKIRLTYSSNGYHRQLLVGADENTTNNFDIGYDAPMADVGTNDMFWKINNGKFVI